MSPAVHRSAAAATGEQQFRITTVTDIANRIFSPENIVSSAAQTGGAAV
jgi:hypothetical protein